MRRPRWEFCPFRCSRGALVDPQPIYLTTELLAKDLEQFGLHQLGAQTRKNDLLERLDTNVEMTAAGPTIAGGGAAEQVGADLDIARIALAALAEAGYQEARAPLLNDSCARTAARHERASVEGDGPMPVRRVAASSAMR